MTDWSKEPNKLWRCRMCQVPLTYDEIWWQSSVSMILCETDFQKYKTSYDYPDQQEPVLCADCSDPLSNMDIRDAAQWSGATDEMQLCSKCLAHLQPDTIADAIASMMSLMKDNEDEEE